MKYILPILTLLFIFTSCSKKKQVVYVCSLDSNITAQYLKIAIDNDLRSDDIFRTEDILYSDSQGVLVSVPSSDVEMVKEKIAIILKSKGIEPGSMGDWDSSNNLLDISNSYNQKNVPSLVIHSLTDKGVQLGFTFNDFKPEILRTTIESTPESVGSILLVSPSGVEIHLSDICEFSIEERATFIWSRP